MAQYTQKRTGNIRWGLAAVLLGLRAAAIHCRGIFIWRLPSVSKIILNHGKDTG